MHQLARHRCPAAHPLSEYGADCHAIVFFIAQRGLVGTVFVLEETVQIGCQGPVERLKSFADWIENSSMLVTNVDIMDADSVSVPLTNKFPLAEAEGYSGGTPGSFSGTLAEQLKTLSMDIKAKQGKTHSSDEGLAL